MEHNPRNIRIAVLLGSVRPDNYTEKVASVLLDEFRKRGVTLEVYNPAGRTLAQPGLGDTADSKELQRMVREAAGVVLATPEYHGSYSSVMKQMIENMGFPSALKGKPVGLLGVAAGSIGAIKALEHLRSVVSHVGGHPLPGVVSVAFVQKAFTAQGELTDPRTEKIVRSLAGNLMDYLKAHVCPGIALEELLRKSA